MPLLWWSSPFQSRNAPLQLKIAGTSLCLTEAQPEKTCLGNKAQHHSHFSSTEPAAWIPNSQLTPRLRSSNQKRSSTSFLKIFLVSLIGCQVLGHPFGQLFLGLETQKQQYFCLYFRFTSPAAARGQGGQDLLSWLLPSLKKYSAFGTLKPDFTPFLSHLLFIDFFLPYNGSHFIPFYTPISNCKAYLKSSYGIQ